MPPDQVDPPRHAHPDVGLLAGRQVGVGGADLAELVRAVEPVGIGQGPLAAQAIDLVEPKCADVTRGLGIVGVVTCGFGIDLVGHRLLTGRLRTYSPQLHDRVTFQPGSPVGDLGR